MDLNRVSSRAPLPPSLSLSLSFRLSFLFSCKFEGIRVGVDKKSVVLSLRRRLSRKECRIDGNSIQLEHSQLEEP